MDVERSCTSQVALDIFEAWLKNNNISHRVRHDCNNVSHVELVDSNRAVVSSGSGKGESYKLGGLAEAIEHYYTIYDSPVTTLRKTHDVSSQEPLSRCGVIAGLHHYKDDQIDTLSYHKWGKDSAVCDVPNILINPWYIKKDTLLTSVSHYLARYSTNSGTALGITTEDAVLHGLSEEIERHYLSHFFLKEAGLKTEFEFQELIVEEESWIDQNPYKDMIDLLSKHYCFKIVVSSSFASMGFCVVVGNRKDDKGESFSLIGSGASFDYQWAVKRALGEFIQSHEFSDESGQEKRDLIASKIKQRSPNLAPLISLLNVSYPKRSLQSYCAKNRRATREIIDDIGKELEKEEFSIFYRYLTPRYEKFSVVSVYIPRFERFHLIRSGNFVAPQEWLFDDRY